MDNIPFIPGGIENLSRDSRSRDVSEIDRISRDKLSMPPGMKGILSIKFDLLPPPGGYVIILVCMCVCAYVCMCVCL